MLAGMFAPHGASGGGGGGPYLDELAVLPRAAFGLRKLISTATLCCRIRNNTTNVETDIGFSGDLIDEATLEAAVPGASARVVKWYDQTGNGEDLGTTTAAAQPEIANAGAFLGFLLFNGSSYLSIASLALGTPQVGVYTRGRFTGTSGVQVFCEMTTVASSNNQTFLMYNNGGSFLVDSYNTAPADRARSYTTLTTTAQLTYLLDRSIVGASEINAFVNGAARTVNSEAATTEQTGNYATNDFYLGSRAGSTFFAQVEIDKLVIYNADTASIRTDIEAIVATT